VVRYHDIHHNKHNLYLAFFICYNYRPSLSELAAQALLSPDRGLEIR